MIPVHDDNPTHGRPVVTIGLIIANVIIFLGCALQGQRYQELVWRFGFVPAALTHDVVDVRDAIREMEMDARPQLVRDRRTGRIFAIPQKSMAETATALPAAMKLFTCMFMHGGLMHLLGNMLYLWIFGNNIEDRLGPALFAVFYLATGVIGTLAHTFIDPDGLVPLIGASGAISGVLGAYILLFPRARIMTLVPIGFYLTTIMLPAWIFLGVYAVLQVLNGLPALTRFQQGGVAYWAHIGGFVAGLLLIRFLPQKKHARPIRARPLDAIDHEPDDDFPFLRL